MAERRMFSKKITDNENFYSLSASAQALYFHLAMCADDDGFSDQLSLCMFKAHASVSDCEVLVNKKYIIQFENGVIVIKHWLVNNKIRKERYHPTIYQEEFKNLFIKQNNSYTLTEPTNVEKSALLPCGGQLGTQTDDNWVPVGCQLGTQTDDNWAPEVRLGKVSIDNKEIYKEKNVNQQVDSARVSKTKKQYDEDINAVYIKWNQVIEQPKISKINDKRKKALIKLFEEYGTEEVLKAIDTVKASDFLSGRGNSTFIANFDFFINPTKFLRIYEGAYNNNHPSKVTKGITLENQHDYDFDEYEKAILSN